MADGDVEREALCTGVVAKDVFEEDVEFVVWMGNTLEVDRGEMFNLSCLNSIRKRRLTRLNLDCATVPITSAYKSVTYWLSEDSWLFWSKVEEL